MKMMKSLLTHLICYSLLFNSTAIASEGIMTEEKIAPPKKMLFLLLTEIDKRYSILGKRIDHDLVAETAKGRKDFRLKKIDADIKKLQEKDNYFEAYIKEASEKNLLKSAEQKNEIRYHLEQMSIPQLDKLAKGLDQNINYIDQSLEYASSFTRKEKLQALSKALFRDFDHLTTMNQKKLRKMTKSALIKNLEHSKLKIQNFDDTNEKGLRGKKKWIAVLAIAGVAILVGGIVAWAKYSGDYKDAKNEREEQLNNLRNRLESEFQELSSNLTQNELDFLHNNGFSYQTCGTYQQQDSTICSNYDYSLISGTKFCTVYCYKNNSTGQETLHSEPVCTSPFIPANCDDPNEYRRGFDHGYDIGFDYGDTDGTIDGQDDGIDDGDYYGDRDGYDDGYDSGYNDGWDDGYWDYSFFKKKRVPFSELAKEKGYESGFKMGRKDAIIFKTMNSQL